MKPVVARIEGGLGNQMFQYAAARALADRLGCDLSLDLSGLACNGDRAYALDQYRIRAKVACEEELQNLPDWRRTRVGRFRSMLSAWGLPLAGYSVFWPESFAFDPRFNHIQSPVYLVGYWQSEQYFVDHRAALLKDLTRLDALPSPTMQWVARVQGCNSVCLHIRRGDYITNAAASQFHGVCDLSYYDNALTWIGKQHPDIHIFAFSDEPEWVKSHLKTEFPLTVVDANPPEQGGLDLEIMRHCRHHIIANSSFSWWGAWLADSQGQIVLAPSRWFADSSVDTSDVIPKRWLKLG